MIELVEDPLVQLNLKSFYDENKTKGVEFLENMLHGLTSDDYTFLDWMEMGFSTIESVRNQCGFCSFWYFDILCFIYLLNAC